MSIMRSSEFCNIKSEGEKASAVNMVFEILTKGSSGELEVDECLAIHNHHNPATIFALSNMIVNLGITNHPLLIESYNNIIVQGVPPTEMGSATFDNVAGNNTKKCAPSKKSWENTWAKGGSCSYTIPCGRNLADSYSIYLFNPFKDGDSKEAVLHITREELLRLNPKWTGENAPEFKSIHIGVTPQTGEITKTNKYYSLIQFEEAGRLHGNI